MKGYVQIYTGDGKGKTTAALGLALRAIGAGLKVYFGQFIKKGNYSEITMLKRRFPEVTVMQYGCGGFIKGRPSPKDIRAAQKGLSECQKAMLSGHYDLVIADELNSAVSAGLLGVEELLRLIDEKPDHVELVITGRGAHARVIKRADLVTEMKGRKHYFEQGVPARKGIES